MLLFPWLGGCQSEIQQVAVKGMVTYDNEPIKDGQIAFEPLSKGKMQFGIIVDGKYSVPQQFGLTPGKYVVRITASRPTGEAAETNSFLTEGVPLGVNEQFIPSKYHTASTLTVDIEATDEVTQDFSLTSDQTN